MELSLFVAKLLSLVYIAASIAVLTGNVSFEKIAKDFENSPALTFVTGFLAVVVGGLLVQYHNVWTKDWTTLVTVVGWAALLKWVFFLAFPNALRNFRGVYKNTRVCGVAFAILGLMFWYFGFFG